MSRLDNISNYKSINSYVNSKLASFNRMERSFKSLFKLMFSEEDNILYEKSHGFMVLQTTYGKAKHDILKRASVLKEMLSDIEDYSVVGLYMDNSLDWIENFWAIILCGYRPLLMNLRVDIQNLEDIINSLKIKAVISDSRSFSVDTVKNDEITQKLSLVEEVDEDDLTYGQEFFVMSSGTSSHVKVCAYTAEEVWYQINDSGVIIRQCAQIKKHYNGQLKLLTFLPFYHIFGLVAVYIWFTFFGRTLVQLNDMRPDTITGTIKKHQVTHIFAVPLFWETVYSSAMRQINALGDETVARFKKGMRISEKLSGCAPLCRLLGKLAYKEIREKLFGDSIIFMITGGSAISPEALSFFNYIGYHLADGYGMSEIGITSVELSRSIKKLNSASVGVPLSSFSYRINSDGELEVKGKACAHYIIVDGKKQDRQEWFNTRDLAEYKNGRYYIMGRSDDLVISASGENMNPGIIEPLFEDILDSQGVALVKYDNGQKTVPALVISIDGTLDEIEHIVVRRRIEARINELGMSGEIGKVIVLPEPLMRADEFKLNRRLIAKRARDYQEYLDSLKKTKPIFDMSKPLTRPDEVTNARDEITGEAKASVTIERVSEIVGKVLDRPDLGETENIFTECQANSLDYLAIMADIETETGVRLPIEEDKIPNSVRMIYEYICNTKRGS